jgi:hypothetical protein
MPLFSELCPIFNTGVEKEMQIRIPTTTASVSIMWHPLPFGRRVKVIEAYGTWEFTSSTTVSNSCDIGIWKGSMCTQIASLSMGTESIPVMTAASVTSTDFGSTDIICANVVTKGTTEIPIDVIVRYKEQ